MTSKKLFLLSVLLLLHFSSAHAAILQADESLSISLPVQDDLYAAGGDVRISQNVDGDTIVAGGDLSISSAIQQDLIAIGGDVDIEGSIGDDVRVAGGTIDLSATVGDDVFIMAGEVDIREDTVINGDLHIAGGDISIAGTVLGNVYIDGGSVRMTATVGGDVSISADTVHLASAIEGNVKLSAKTVKSLDGTAIQGNLNYWVSDDTYQIPEGVVTGDVILDEELAMHITKESTQKKASGLFYAGAFGYSLLASALIIFLCILLTKNYFSDAAKKLLKEPGMSVWYGFLYVIVTPFLALVFFLTVIGIPIGLLVVISYLFTFFFIKPMTSIVLAKVLEMKYKKKWGITKLFLTSLGLFVCWKIMLLIPIVGTLMSAVLVLAGFGTLAQTEWMKFKKVR